MKLHCIFVALAASLAFMLMDIAEAQSTGPIDVLRTEGDTNEFIPCPFSGGSASFWKINDTFYHHTRLPCPFIASTSPEGIRIALLERSISGTSFQCFSSSTRNGAIMASSIGVLTVNRNPLYTGDGEEDNSTAPALTIDLIYQQLRFTSRDFSLSWNLFNKDDIQDDVDSQSTQSYYIYTSDCDLSNVSVAVNTTDTSTVLTRNQYENDYFNITAFNNNKQQIGTINEPLRINSVVETEAVPQLFIGRTCPACVSVPQPEMAPFFNIPRSAGSNQRDTLCPVVRPVGETGRCLDLANTCADFRNSQFTSSITVCSSTTSTIDYQMCFSNITKEINGTKIHFFYSSRPFCSITNSRARSWLCIASYEIAAQESSGNINVTTNTSSGELCIVSLPEGCYTTTVYNVTIYDVTESLVYTEMNIQDNVCTQVDLLRTLDSECAPYTIAVDASNPYVIYQTVYHMVGELSTSYCDCAKRKAKVQLIKSTSSEIQFSCNTDADHNIRFSIVVVDVESGSTIFPSELVTCTSTPNVPIPSQVLECNGQYSVSAHFAFRNGTVTECLLSTTDITFSEDCPTTNAPTFSPPTILIVEIVVPIVIVVIIFIIAIVVIVLVVYRKVKASSRVYRPQNVERRSGVTDPELKMAEYISTEQEGGDRPEEAPVEDNLNNIEKSNDV